MQILDFKIGEILIHKIKVTSNGEYVYNFKNGKRHVDIPIEKYIYRLNELTNGTVKRIVEKM